MFLYPESTTRGVWDQVWGAWSLSQPGLQFLSPARLAAHLPQTGNVSDEGLMDLAQRLQIPCVLSRGPGRLWGVTRLTSPASGLVAPGAEL